MIDLSIHKARVAAQDKLDQEHLKAYRRLPKDDQGRYIAGRDLIRALSRAHRGKTLSIEVVKSWLYAQGLNESAARTALWCAAGEGSIHFNKDYDVECGRFEALD